ncbi:MAG: acyltransferase, partial [Hyphomicrobiales bacterium]
MPRGSAETSKARLAGIQYLRAVAATAVLAFHAASRAGISFWIGEAGVDLFFLLSGFLMIAISDETSRPVSFLKDRIGRIVPTYWIATSVLLCAGLCGLFPQLAIAPVHVAMSYLFLPSAHPITGMAWPLLIPGWTLNYEMFFYALFALTMGAGTQMRQVIAVAAILFGLVALGALVRPDALAARFYTDPILLEFAGGVMIGYWWKHG